MQKQNFAYMKHHGKIIESQVIRSGKKRQEIAKQLGITRQTFANKLKTPNLPIDFILRVGKILHYNFSEDIAELKQFNLSVASEPAIEYRTSASAKDDNWKEKYFLLLEDYNKHLRQKQDTTQLLIAAIEEFRKEMSRFERKGTAKK